jgi:hypothetical protein
MESKRKDEPGVVEGRSVLTFPEVVHKVEGDDSRSYE